MKKRPIRKQERGGRYARGSGRRKFAITKREAMPPTIPIKSIILRKWNDDILIIIPTTSFYIIILRKKGFTE